VDKSITDVSCTNILVVGAYGGTITATLPSDADGQLSSAPLTGSYFLRCYDLAGNPHDTTVLPWYSNLYAVKDALVAACSDYRDSITVAWNSADFSYIENGISYTVDFPLVAGAVT
jgi:hypothetical protein